MLIRRNHCEHIRLPNILNAYTFSYQHILTGAKSDQQEDVLGGIFADDMGLGKSLVMLAIIAASLGRAKEFSVLKNRPDKDAQRSGQRNSRATLILVPSIC